MRMDDISAGEIYTAIKPEKYKASGIDEINQELLKYGHGINVKLHVKPVKHIWKNKRYQRTVQEESSLKCQGYPSDCNN